MKSLKAILPIITFWCATTVALGNQSFESIGQLPHKGHKSVGMKCVPTEVACTEVPTGVVCRDDSEKALYLYIGPISCSHQLWKPVP